MATTAIFRYDGSEDLAMSRLDPVDEEYLRRVSGLRVEVREEQCDEYGIIAIRFPDGGYLGAHMYELSEWQYDDEED
jgi:hypothetical protein